MLDRLQKPRNWEVWTVFILLACGALARLVWIVRAQNLAPYLSESHHIAISLAVKGAFADPFGFATGPTAHLGMFTPLPSAVAYWLLGPGTPAAEFALSFWSLAIVLLGIWFCWRLACELDMPRVARIGAVAFAAIAPLQFKLELQEGRNWEVSLAAMILIFILLRIVGADRKDSMSTLWLLSSGAVAGLLFIISPPAGLAGAAALAVFQCLVIAPRRWWIAPAAFTVVAGLLSGIWAVRNVHALNSPIALRDNLGLEMAISNYDGAVHPVNPLAAYVGRLKDIHPIQSEAARAAMRKSGGELQYYRQLEAKTREWIVRHPVNFLLLSVRHFFQFYFPPLWFWYGYGPMGAVAAIQQFLLCAIAVLGVCGLVFMARRQRRYAYLLVASIVCSLPYMVIQPTLRYRYLVSTILIFLAFDGVARVIGYFVARKAERLRSSSPAEIGLAADLSITASLWSRFSQRTIRPE